MDAMLTDREVARLLRRSIKWLSEHRGELEAAGFPKRVPVVGRYDPAAIRAWLDRQENPAPNPGQDVMARMSRWGKSA
jgi:hypothetical protein